MTVTTDGERATVADCRRALCRGGDRASLRHSSEPGAPYLELYGALGPLSLLAELGRWALKDPRHSMNMLGYTPRNRKLSPQRVREIPTTILEVIGGTHQTSRITARLPDETYVELETAAQAAGVTVEEHAAKILAGSVVR